MRYCTVCGIPIKRGERCRPHAYERKMGQCREYQKRVYVKPKPKPERIERKCLKCRRTFMAEGRFNRVCPLCTKVNETVVDPEVYGAIIQ